MSWFRRLTNVLRVDRLAREAEREMTFHLAELVDELVATGMTEAEARREARRRFGDHDELRERVHRVEVLVWLESWLADLRYAIRGLRKNPGFATVAVLSLGLGIGANTAIFSLINAVMLRSLPVSNPEELVRIELEDAATLPNPMWEEIRDKQGALASTFAFSDQTFNLSDGGVVRGQAGAWVSGDYFNALGVRAARGRVLNNSDDFRGCPAIAVLGHGFWQQEFGGADDAVGRTILLDGHSFQIVGVAAPGFSGIHVGRSAGVFTPLCTADIVRPGRELLDARSTWFIYVFGRMGPGVTLPEAQVGLAAVSRPVLEASVPTRWTPEEQREFEARTLIAVSATTGLSLVRGQYQTALYALLVVVGVVLLIACANVAQLLLARATARQHEVAVRLAIGSGRGRLVRQLLTESVLLALLGAAVGALFARWSSGLVVGFLSQAGRSVSLDLSLDPRVLGFTIAVATVTGILFGLAPAWRSTRVAPQAAMRGSGRGLVGGTGQRFTKGIVVGQVALSLVLVVAAGLLVGTFQRLTTIDTGFQPEDLLIAEAGWADLDLSAERQAVFPRELVDRLRLIPGVQSASASFLTPISGTSWNDYVILDGPEDGNDEALIWFNAVSDGYLETLGTRLLAGRDFDRRDRAQSPPVALINETLARRFFGDANPLGRQMRISDHDSLGTAMEIVGVVADTKYRRVQEETLATAFVPLEQSGPWSQSIKLSLRSETGPTTLVPAVTEAMRELHPAITLEFDTMTEQIASSLARPRLLATLSGFFGALALLLAVIGLYGTMSYSVARRRNEMGIRVALGAAQGRIVGLVAGEAGRVVGIGVVLGLLLAIATTRLIASFLYGIDASDPITLVVSAMILGAVAMAAALVPAWRAAVVDPMVTLREE